jgi:hypothetical protein
MSTNRSKDRSSLCTFTFADGRRCRTPRRAGHPHLCAFHARKEAQALAGEAASRAGIGRISRLRIAQDSLVTNLFRMNTRKSVSKQKTLTSFRINTYEKRGGGGLPEKP